MLGGPAGDALITVEFVPHPHFRVEGDALRREVNIPLEDAVLGGKIRVPTLDGEVSMSIPSNSSGGRSLRLKGKGLPKAGGGRGDLLVSLRIVLPEGGDAELTELMKTWRESGRYSATEFGKGSLSQSRSRRGSPAQAVVDRFAEAVIRDRRDGDPLGLAVEFAKGREQARRRLGEIAVGAEIDHSDGLPGVARQVGAERQQRLALTNLVASSRKRAAGA